MRPIKALLAIRRSHSRSAYEIILQRHGLDVVAADDGIQCLDVLRRFTPNVVVVEPELLWGGGDGIVSVLRDDPQTRGVPVLVLTTDASRSAVYRISQFSVGDYLTQPVAPEQLTSLLVRLAVGNCEFSIAESSRWTAAIEPSSVGVSEQVLAGTALPRREE